MIVAAGSQNGASATTASSSRWAASSTAISPPSEVPQTSTRSLTSRRAQASTAAQSSTDWRTISRVQARSAWMKPSPLLRPGLWRRRCRGRSIRAAWAPLRDQGAAAPLLVPGARRQETVDDEDEGEVAPVRAGAVRVATRCRLPGSPPGPWLGPVRVRTSTPPRRRCCTGPAVIGAGSWTRLAAQNSCGSAGVQLSGTGSSMGRRASCQRTPASIARATSALSRSNTPVPRRRDGPFIDVRPSAMYPRAAGRSVTRVGADLGPADNRRGGVFRRDSQLTAPLWYSGVLPVTVYAPAGTWSEKLAAARSAPSRHRCRAGPGDRTRTGHRPRGV